MAPSVNYHFALNVTVLSIIAGCDVDRRRPYDAAEAETPKLVMVVVMMMVMVLDELHTR